jgi:uncharacterized cupredoxin-like copper-binding protein
MTVRKLVAGAVAISMTLAASGVAVAAGKAPKRATIKVSQKLKMKPNRYVQDGLRWNKDVYRVRSGGTLHIVNTVATEGPHTFTVVKKKDLPRNAKQLNNCKICNTLTQAHGADPNSDAPPQFPFLENGVGQATPPNVDRPGDSGVTGPGNKGESIDLTVTAKKGSTLYFMCLVHPWMEAKVKVG